MNVLVLDEPTNHLDIPSREALEEALSAYEGTIVTISHDRYFLDRVATQILALDGWEMPNITMAITRSTTIGNSVLADLPLPVPHVASQTIWSVLALAPAPVAPAPVNEECLRSEEAWHQSRQEKEARCTNAGARRDRHRARRTTSQRDLAADGNAGNRARRRQLIALNDEYQQTETLLRTLYDEWDRVSQEPATAR